MITWKNFPLYNKFVGITSFDDSFLRIHTFRQFEIPMGRHVGAFGAIRKHDIHKGVDLYCKDGCSVFAVEDGVVLKRRPWTGEKAGSPFWHETDALIVRGSCWIIAYGEIRIASGVIEGSRIEANQEIGRVKEVLKTKKGRPTSMLHLQMYNGEPAKVGTWELGQPKPENLIDPTPMLLETAIVQSVNFAQELIEIQRKQEYKDFYVPIENEEIKGGKKK